MQALAKDNNLWIPEVTRRDSAAATLETGHCEDDNVAGFRIRLQHRAAAGEIDIELKVAGAYFVDIGVDKAIADFRRELPRCLDREVWSRETDKPSSFRRGERACRRNIRSKLAP